MLPAAEGEDHSEEYGYAALKQTLSNHQISELDRNYREDTIFLQNKLHKTNNCLAFVTVF